MLYYTMCLLNDIFKLPHLKHCHWGLLTMSYYFNPGSFVIWQLTPWIKAKFGSLLWDCLPFNPSPFPATPVHSDLSKFCSLEKGSPYSIYGSFFSFLSFAQCPEWGLLGCTVQPVFWGWLDMKVMGLQANIYLEVEGPSKNPHVDQQHMVSSQ